MFWVGDVKQLSAQRMLQVHPVSREKLQAHRGDHVKVAIDFKSLTSDKCCVLK